MSLRGRVNWWRFGSCLNPFSLVWLLVLSCHLHLLSSDFRVFIGTYTRGASEGIYAFDFSSETGKAGGVQLVAQADNPSFLALHGETLYAVNEVNSFGGESSGAVSAFRMGPGGGLEFLNQLASGGGAPCHLVVDREGETLLVANYSGGNVASFRLESDGRIKERRSLIQHLGSSVNRRRQTAPHAHSINLDPANRFAAAADLGVDRVFVYPFNSDAGKLELVKAQSVSLPAGAGPRHFAFHPNQKLAFVNNELHSSLTSLAFDSNSGQLRVVATLSTLPDGFSGGNSTAETQVHPDGRTVYVSNRGHDSIAQFRVNPKSGQIERLGWTLTEGRTPRNFCLSPDGDYLLAANQSSDSVVIFPIDAGSGRLKASVGRIAVPSPVCVKFLRLN